MKIPSDFKLMTEIYERYFNVFKNFSHEKPCRECKIYVPIDIKAIADHLKTDEYILFGRLYTHLDKKYGYKNDDGSISPLFSMKAGKDKNVINFPLLASVLAGLQEERSRQNLTFKISAAAIIISLFALFFNGINVWHNTMNGSSSHTQQEIQETQEPLKK